MVAGDLRRQAPADQAEGRRGRAMLGWFRRKVETRRILCASALFGHAVAEARVWGARLEGGYIAMILVRAAGVGGGTSIFATPRLGGGKPDERAEAGLRTSPRAHPRTRASGGRDRPDGRKRGGGGVGDGANEWHGRGVGGSGTGRGMRGGGAARCGGEGKGGGALLSGAEAAAAAGAGMMAMSVATAGGRARRRRRRRARRRGQRMRGRGGRCGDEEGRGGGGGREGGERE